MKYVRQATLGDLSEISAIFEDAKKVLSNDGSSQWQNGSPSIENFKKDIGDGCCYVLIVDEEVAGMASLIEGPDKNYQRIDSEEWKNKSDDYIAIHRVAISSKYQGMHLNDTLFACLLTVIETKGFKHVRIDTHPKNQRLQHIADKFGFEYRGIVYIEDETVEPERKAYELELG